MTIKGVTQNEEYNFWVVDFIDSSTNNKEVAINVK